MKPLSSSPLGSQREKIDQKLWLEREIPHRICAALTWLEMPAPWDFAKPSLTSEEEKKKHPPGSNEWCVGRAVDEGRKVAMRWLIDLATNTKRGQCSGK